MNKDDIKQFMKAFKDFMKHSEEQEFYYNQRIAHGHHRAQARLAIENEIEKKAAELEVTVDYYMAEFM